MSLEPTTNFKDSNGVDLGSKLVTKDYLISVYPEIGSQIGIPPELWVWGNGSLGRLGTNDTINRSIPVTTFIGGSNWKQVSAGNQHVAAIKTDGTLWTWGFGSAGRLGNANTTNRSTPVTTFAGGTNWKQVSAADDHTAAIKTDGTLWTWGAGTAGQLGKNRAGSVSTPITTFAGGTDWKQVSSGNQHTAAIKTDGTLWTWGDSRFLGSRFVFYISTPITTFVGGDNWKTIELELYTLSAGGGHTSAVKLDGTLWTWGLGSSGQLGNSTISTNSIPNTTFTGGTNWIQVSSGYNHTAAIKADGTLWTWGDGSNGRLGNANTTNRSTPVTTFAGGTNWRQVSCGGYHTSAIKIDGTLWLWGRGNNRQLGNNALTATVSTPVTTFAGGTNWKQVSGGKYHTAAVKLDGTLWVWGTEFGGQLGTNFGSDTNVPVTTFAGGTDWKQVSASYQHTAAIKTDGTLWTWGTNSVGALGTNSASASGTPVTTFAGGTNWKQVSCGSILSAGTKGFTAAVKNDGTIWTWGSNISGQLGTNDTTNRLTPVTTFAGGTNWKQISAGYNHTIALRDDGNTIELFTWGNGILGSLGNASTSNRSTPVTTFSGAVKWSDTATAEPEDLYTLDAGSESAAAIKNDGTLWIWGNPSFGTMGDASTTGNKSTPITTFSGGSNWKQISVGSFNTAAIKTDGTLWTWGNGANGRLGNAVTTGNRSTPITTFAGGIDWKQVSVGTNNVSAIKTDGTLWTWGNGTAGQLGNNQLVSRSTPVTTFTGGTNWKHVSSGHQHVAAIKTDGTLWTWGDGTFGATSRVIWQLVPVTTFAGGTNWVDTATTEPEDLYTLSAGGRHSGAIKTDGTLWTWGYASNGRLANASLLNDTSTPITTFTGGTNWKQISFGVNHSTAIKTDGTLWTWGAGFAGRLGDRNVTDRSTPVTTFAGGTNWKQVSAGTQQHTAAIKTDGTLWTWGNGNSGGLGNANTLNRSTPITTFAGGTDWKHVSVGGFHTVATKTDGTLWTWGRGTSGQLGDASLSSKSTPVTTFTGGTDWKQVSCGDSFTTAIKTDGTLWTWGAQSSLGNGATTGTMSTPITTFAGGTNWKQVDAGSFHTAAIKTDGTLWTWGFGSNGRLGNANTTNRSTPVTTFAGGTNWKQVSSGYNHTVALSDTGLFLFGNNSKGQIGNATIEPNVAIPLQALESTTDWKQVSSGYQYTAAIKTNGTLWIWGLNNDGKIGNANIDNIFTPVTTFAGGTNWKQVNAGDFATSAIKTDGTLWVWGNASSGSLGNSLTTGIISTPITTFTGGTNWKQVSSGYNSTLALSDDGLNNQLWLFGVGGSGQLGNADITNRSTPVTVFSARINWIDVETEKPEDLYTLSGGTRHTAAIKTDGTLWVWGNASNGRIGISDLENRITPVTLFVGGTNWKQVSSGNDHATAIDTNGILWSWGSNGNGQLGRSSLQENIPVTTFAGGNNWADTATAEPEDLYTLSAGNIFTTAIKTDGTLWTWGATNNGRLGNGVTLGNRSTAITTFAGGTNWKQVDAGYEHTAAVKTDGTLWLWGSGSSRQIGNNAIGSISIPITTLIGGSNWKHASAGSFHTAAIKTDGTLWAWGNSINGQLGFWLDFLISTPITTFAGGNNWADTATAEPEDLYTLDAGSNRTAAIKTDGTLWLWGEGNLGELGIALSNTYNITPVTTFTGGTNWKQISCGYRHTAAIKTDGTLWTWGNGNQGQLGNSSLSDRSTPITTFSGGTDWKQVSSGYAQTLAIKTDGTLWVWGNGNGGRLGTNSTNNALVPITTFSGGTDWKQVSSGFNNAAAVKTDGTLWTWGNNADGRLGVPNLLTLRLTPITTFAGGTNWKQVNCSIGFSSDFQQNVAAVKTDGTLWIWGNGSQGQLGNALTTGNRSTPITTFAGGTNWKQVNCGNNFTAAVKTDGTLWTWGYGFYGKLGNANISNRSTPITTFAGGTNWKQVSCGRDHVVALKDDGVNKELFVFGDAQNKQLGNKIDDINQVFGNSTNWKQVSCGRLHTAAIKTDGTLWTWGWGNYGRLGNGDESNKSTPVTTFAGGTDWKQVSVGNFVTAAIKTDGTLWAWGNGTNGGLGNSLASGLRSTPITTFAGGTNWKQVTCSLDLTSSTIAAVKTDGTLWTWGNGSFGQLGNANITNRSTPVTTFVGGTNWKQVSLGTEHTVALKDDGVNKELFVFGNHSSFGQLGFPPFSNFELPKPIAGDNWKQVSSGVSNTAAIKTDGTLWTWGLRINGRLGNAFISTANIDIPITTFAGGTDWKQVSCSGNFTAAIKTDGTLWTWGVGIYGQLGTTTTTLKSTPVTTFAGGTNWKQVSISYYHAAAIKTDGTLWTWGSGNNGRLGNSITGFSVSTPVTTFAGGTNWKQVSAANDHTAAIKTDGTLWTWGVGIYGQLGNGDESNKSTPVTTFAGGTNWKQVDAGSSHTIALKDDGLKREIFIFGNSDLSGANKIDAPNIDFPITTFAGGTNWKQVSAGDNHTAAIKTDGTLWVWGNGEDGKLGSNSENNVSTPVTTFAGGTNWKQVSSGYRYTATIKTDGTLWTWGRGTSGQLGDNNIFFSYRSTPITTFAGGTNWADTPTTNPEDLYTLSVGVNQSTAIKTDGTLWTWGRNLYGRLGSADTTSRSTPITTFAGGTNWKQTSSGGYHMAAIKTDGTLWVWGNGNQGQLGHNTFTNASTPITTFAGGTNWKQVSAGYEHTAAVKTDGTLWVWGQNNNGQHGTNSVLDSETPITTFAGGNDWKQVHSGFDNTLAIKTDGTLWGWGFHSMLATGSDSTVDRLTPVTTFAGGNDWRQVSTNYDHSAAIKTDGTLWLWGTANGGQLGNGNFTFMSTPITTFAGGTNWKQVSIGRFHTTAIKTDGTLWTWGDGNNGSLGNSDTIITSTPVTTFVGGTNWRQVNTSGIDHIIALKSDGTLWSWGDSDDGELGINIELGHITPVTTSAGGTNWKQVNAGYYHTAAIKTDGTLWAWGTNFDGRLGNGSLALSNILTPITTFAGGTNWKQVDAGGNYIVAIRSMEF